MTVEYGVPHRVTPRATLVRAANPGPMTLEGTNSWLLAEPGSTDVVVVDPGPDDPAHLDALLAAVAGPGGAGGADGRVAAVLLTHGHPDHAEGAASLARRAASLAGRTGGVGVLALDPAHRLGDEGLTGGQTVAVGGLEVRVVATPGHTGDSLSFHLSADGAVLTGDTVLGRGSTVVAHPDGRLADYLASLHRLRELAVHEGATTLLTGHGPVLTDAVAAIEGYLAHRAERLAQVEAALAAGATTAGDVVRLVYADVDPVLWPAAELSVRAQLDYLRR